MESQTTDYATITIQRVVCLRRVGFIGKVSRDGAVVGHVEGEIEDVLAVSAALLVGAGEPKPREPE